MKVKVIFRILFDRGEKFFRLVVRIEKVIEYGENYKARDLIFKEMKIESWFYLSELWLKFNFFGVVII